MYLQLNKISKIYKDRRGNEVKVLDNFDLSVEKGELVALVGPSGCGKTTALRIIAGLEETSNGSVILNGEDITCLPPEKRDMAVVFQHYALFPHMSIFSNVAFGLEMRRFPKEEINRRVLEMLATVGLKNMEGRSPGELSGGQQQRVALARALVVSPRVLLCDEPLSNLDAALRVQMRGEIKALHKKLGLTTVYVTHDEDEANYLADRKIVMKVQDYR